MFENVYRGALYSKCATHWVIQKNLEVLYPIKAYNNKLTNNSYVGIIWDDIPDAVVGRTPIPTRVFSCHSSQVER